MSNSFKLRPRHFSRGGEKFCRRDKAPPGYGPGSNAFANLKNPLLVYECECDQRDE